jgi:hypothetical protein
MKEQNLQSVYLHKHGVVPIAIGMKVETKEGEGSDFVIVLPV